MADAHKNFAYSTVATAPSPATSGTSLVVATGEGAAFPAVPFNATICPAGTQPTNANAEIIRVTASSTDTFGTIIRAQEGTNARTVIVGDQIFAAVTTKTLTDIETLLTYPSFANVVAPVDPRSPFSVPTYPTANTMFGVRVVIPYTGTLRDLAVYVGTVSSGNVDVGVLDTTGTTRNILYTKGSTACPAVNGWRIIGDPNLAVTRGDQYDLLFACDNATATFARLATIGPSQVVMPTGYWTAPLGGVNTLLWTKPTSFPLPTSPGTIAESSFATTSAGFGLFIMGRLS
jgi:hypothetical protein